VTVIATLERHGLLTGDREKGMHIARQ
jgi:hypothetical protein